MNEICPLSRCTACMACVHSCSRHAIVMTKLASGFLYPIINASLCVDCGLCQKVCPVNQEPVPFGPINVFLCWNKQTDVRLESSSGGLFSVIAEWIIDRGGVVCGAAYDERMNVIHQIVEKKEKLKKLRGSKYVQSFIGSVYREIKNALNADRWAYFVGTPCQVAGLKNYLCKDYDKLLTSDLICHGVPSNDLFVKQMRQLEKEHGYRIKEFRFRSKKRFGQGYDLLLFTLKCEKSYNAELMPYFYGFWNNITLRRSCFSCQYAKQERVGDITLGDYWLAKKEFPNVKMSKGLSLILINTTQGEKIWEFIKADVEWRSSTLEQAKRGQGQLRAPVPRPKINERFMQEAGTLSFEACCHKYLIPSTKYKLKCHLKNMVKIVIGFKYWK